jgi:hypothetical protein
MNYKHTSLTIEVVFSSWSVQSGYKEVFGSIEQDRTVGFRDASLPGYELSRGIGVASSELAAAGNDKRGIRLCQEDVMCELK